MRGKESSAAAAQEVKEAAVHRGPFDEEAVAESYESLTRLLIEKELTIATMESCTGGEIATLLTNTEGASAVFRGALIVYCNEAKISLGIPEEVIRENGVYSPETAAAMAEQCRRHFSTALSVGVTGTFGNTDPANADSIPGEVYFAIASGEGTTCYHCTVPFFSVRSLAKGYLAEVIATELREELDFFQRSL